MLLEYGISDAFTAKPPFEIGMLYVLSIFWLGECLSCYLLYNN